MVQYLAPLTVFVSSWVERETESKNLDGLVNYKVKHKYLDIVTRKLSDFPCVCLEHIYYFFKILAVLSSFEFLHCNVLKKMKGNSKFFQLLPRTNNFVLAAFVHLNIGPFLILFLVDIIK